jgi:hypothetical protein
MPTIRPLLPSQPSNPIGIGIPFQNNLVAEAGNDIQKGKVVGSMQECISLCESNPNCKQATYLKDRSMCWTKAAYNRTAPYQGWATWQRPRDGEARVTI